MFKRIIKYWNKPYPAFDNPKGEFLTAFFFGLFVFLFLLVFKPFGVKEKYEVTVFYIAGFGLVTFLIVIINSLLIRLLPAKIINLNDWRLKHTMFVSILNLLTIAAGNYYYMRYTGIGGEVQHSLIQVLFYTIAVGIFPTLGFLAYSEHYLLTENRKRARVTDELLKQKREVGAVYGAGKQLSGLPGDDAGVERDKLLYVKADGNYSTFFIDENGDIKTRMVRIAFKNVEALLQDYPEFIKCHRSYIVNLERVESATGNARNVSLCLDLNGINVPVSRAKEKDILTAIRNK